MRTRLELLASPLFVGSVAVLALNDHVFKDSAPGLVTGKLSDLAGLFLVTILLGVLIRSRSFASFAVGLGFVALKTMPGVAVLAAPVLGGRTIVDNSDLVALVALAPAWWWLGRHQEARPGEARAVLGLLGAVVAMTTVTATSCGLPDQVEHLARTPDGALVASVRENYEVERAVSRHGRDWTAARAAGGRFVDRRSACLSDGSCFRVVPGRRVEARDRNGRWRTAYEYTAEQRRRHGMRVQRCAGSVSTFASLAVAGTGRDQHVVVVMGPDGVLSRRASGGWERRAVFGVQPTRLDGSIWLSSLGLTPFVVALVIGALLLVGRLTKRRRSHALFCALIGMPVCLAITGGLDLAGVDYTVWGPAAIGLVVAVLVASPFIARLIPRRTVVATGFAFAGWHPDPHGGDQLRWWDGHAWTQWTSPRR